MHKIAFIFPGQGSQTEGMGYLQFNKYTFVKELFNLAEDCLDFKLKELCFHGDMKTMQDTVVLQPAILTVSVANYLIMKHLYELKPFCLAGHSVGEYSALVCAGVIKFEDAIRLVSLRGKLMKDAIKEMDCAMFALKADLKSQIDEALYTISAVDDCRCYISNYNSPTQIVLSGLEHDVMAVIQKVQKTGVNAIRLKTSAPFHTPLMKQASDIFKEELERITLLLEKAPVIHNGAAFSGIEIKKALVEQFTMPVYWEKTMHYLNKNTDAIMDAGPGSVLCKLSRENNYHGNIFSYAIREDRDAFMKYAASYGTSVQEFKPKECGRQMVAESCLKTATCTKSNCSNQEEYEIGIARPYRELKEMVFGVNLQNTKRDNKLALQLLKQILDTKMVPQEEQKSRLKDIFSASDASQELREYATELFNQIW